MKLSTFIKLVKKAYIVRYNEPTECNFVCYAVGDVTRSLYSNHLRQAAQYNKLYCTISAQIYKTIASEISVYSYLEKKLERNPTPEECHNFRLCMLNDMYEAAVLEERDQVQ